MPYYPPLGRGRCRPFYGGSTRGLRGILVAPRHTWIERASAPPCRGRRFRFCQRSGTRAKAHAKVRKHPHESRRCLPGTHDRNAPTPSFSLPIPIFSSTGATAARCKIHRGAAWLPFRPRPTHRDRPGGDARAATRARRARCRPSPEAEYQRTLYTGCFATPGDR